MIQYFSWKFKKRKVFFNKQTENVNYCDVEK